MNMEASGGTQGPEKVLVATSTVRSLGCLVIFLVLLSALPMHSMLHARRNAFTHAWKKDCLMQTRKIQTAQDAAILTLPLEAPQQQVLDLAYLKQAGYLKLDVLCPASGTFALNIASPSPIVFCTFHGNEDHRITGRINPGYSLWYWLFYKPKKP